MFSKSPLNSAHGSMVCVLVFGQSSLEVIKTFSHFFLGSFFHFVNLLLKSVASVIGFQLILEKTFIALYYCLDNVDDRI